MCCCSRIDNDGSTRAGLFALGVTSALFFAWMALVSQPPPELARAPQVMAAAAAVFMAAAIVAVINWEAAWSACWRGLVNFVEFCKVRAALLVFVGFFFTGLLAGTWFCFLRFGWYTLGYILIISVLTIITNVFGLIGSVAVRRDKKR